MDRAVSLGMAYESPSHAGLGAGGRIDHREKEECKGCNLKILMNQSVKIKDYFPSRGGRAIEKEMHQAWSSEALADRIRRSSRRAGGNPARGKRTSMPFSGGPENAVDPAPGRGPENPER